VLEGLSLKTLLQRSFSKYMYIFMLQMTPQVMGASVRMLGMVPVLVTDGDIVNDTCASQGAVFQHVYR